MKSLANALPKKVREAIRAGEWDKPTSGLARGYAQASPIIIPEKYADDFHQFLLKNPKPLPLYGISEVGSSKLPFLGDDIDIKYDMPAYRVYKDGEFLADVKNLVDIWQNDFVIFAIGCSFSFEEMLMKHEVPLRNIEENKNVSMYDSSIPLVPHGIFKGNMTVTMRPFTATDAIKAIILTSQLPLSHGNPVHIGNSKFIGIEDLSKPDAGDVVTVNEDDIPIYWGCGVTALQVMKNAKLPIAIVQKPGYMLITDILTESLRVTDPDKMLQ